MFDLPDIQKILEDDAELSTAVETIMTHARKIGCGDDEEDLTMLIKYLTSKNDQNRSAECIKASGIKYSRETLYDIGMKVISRKPILVDIPEIKRIYPKEPIELSLGQRFAELLYHRIWEKHPTNYDGIITFILTRCDLTDIQKMVEDDAALSAGIEAIYSHVREIGCGDDEKGLEMLIKCLQSENNAECIKASGIKYSRETLYDIGMKVISRKPTIVDIPEIKRIYPKKPFESSLGQRFAELLYHRISEKHITSNDLKFTFILMMCDFTDIQKMIEDDAALSVSVGSIFGHIRMPCYDSDEEGLAVLIKYLKEASRPPRIKYNPETLYLIGKQYICRRRTFVDIPQIIAEIRVFNQTTGIKERTKSMKKFPFYQGDYCSYFRNKP